MDLDLLGLVLQTSQIQVNANAITGDGLLLGNVLSTLLNTLGATPENLAALASCGDPFFLGGMNSPTAARAVPWSPGGRVRCRAAETPVRK